MGVVKSYPHGTFCCVDLRTSDSESAKAFYTQLFDWDHIDNPMSPNMGYTLFQKNGHSVAVSYEMNEEMKSQGVPPHWVHYISVRSADEVAAQAGDLGGEVLVEPFDLFESGRMGIIKDPTGAEFAIWEPKDFIGAERDNEPSSLCWNELATWDIDAAREFYTGLFGWTSQYSEAEGGGYTTFMNGDCPIAGMLLMTADWGEMPPHWMAYFAVHDCEKDVEMIRTLGGNVMHGPADIPEVGRFAIASDPQGAMFTIIKLVHSK